VLTRTIDSLIKHFNLVVNGYKYSTDDIAVVGDVLQILTSQSARPFFRLLNDRFRQTRVLRQWLEDFQQDQLCPKALSLGNSMRQHLLGQQSGFAAWPAAQAAVSEREG
jgi:hypothetical protein